MPAFVVQVNMAQGEFGGVQVWSTDSEDEEVRKPTHGRAFTPKQEDSQYSRRCLIVSESGSQMEKNASESGRSKDRCFTTKTVPEQINDCELLINKVNSILESVNIATSRYKTEFNDLKFTFFKYKQ